MLQNTRNEEGGSYAAEKERECETDCRRKLTTTCAQVHGFWLDANPRASMYVSQLVQTQFSSLPVYRHSNAHEARREEVRRMFLRRHCNVWARGWRVGGNLARVALVCDVDAESVNVLTTIIHYRCMSARTQQQVDKRHGVSPQHVAATSRNDAQHTSMPALPETETWQQSNIECGH